MRNLFIVFLLLCLNANSQQVSISLGACVSSLDAKNDWSTSKIYKSPIVLPSASIAYETKIWHRLSLSANASFFVVGGKNKYPIDLSRIYFANYGIGIIPNFYFVNRQSKFYIGIGPRIDYLVWFEGEDQSKLKPYYVKFGLTGSIGYNYHFDHLFLGVKANYYHKFGMPISYKAHYEPGIEPNSPHVYTNRTVKDYTFDLQLVIGIDLGKKSK